MSFSHCVKEEERTKKDKTGSAHLATASKDKCKKRKFENEVAKGPVQKKQQKDSEEHGLYASAYNYYATTKCVKEPQGALYGGGVIVNPEFKHNSQGWMVFGNGKIEERLSKEGNKFIVAHSRTHPYDSLSQQVQVENGKIYTFSAGIQVSEGSEDVTVVFKSKKGHLIHGGTAIAKSGCWTLLKGGMVANFSSPVDIFFQSKNTSVEIWVDSVSLQPFTQKQWRSHQEKSINKVRRSKVRIQVTHENKTLLQGAVVSIKQNKPGFLFGCGMNHNILTSTQYQNWFSSRFPATTFTNEMKWYSTEKVQGHENYTTADAMVEFAQKHGISIRGHNIFWDNPIYQPYWVHSLSLDELRKAAARRIVSVVSKYRGKLIHWDVMNENLHFSFYEDKLGKTASAEYYKRAQQLDPQTTMFLNEYNTIEYSGDNAVTPAKYLKKIEEILSYPGNANLKLGIGLQGHFTSNQPNIAYMRSALDTLGSAKFPIWLTEVSVDNTPNQAKYLEEILREGYAHPAVQGIIMFAGPAYAGFNSTVLADQNFKNTPAGDVVDKLIQEWKSGADQETRTDGQGFIDVSLSHGDYDLTVKHPFTNSSARLSLRVGKDKPLEIIHVSIDT
ncbi:endo-1,4-beta-xylanase 5-like [Humulus lupulus]|uniref:endo-1,4-beta-xylanase 5-like n=1 Tax=Humulus lupulus TaxID=3486 RepID=UPI002B408F8C|nr:endo-1,4-beta-xylanase 5-like [Humulus lupulus]